MIWKKFIDDQIPNYNNDSESKIKQLEDKLAIKTKECEIKESEIENLKEELAKVSEECHGTKVELTKAHSNRKRDKSKLEKELKANQIAAKQREVEFEEDLLNAEDVIEKKESRIQ